MCVCVCVSFSLRSYYYFGILSATFESSNPVSGVCISTANSKMFIKSLDEMQSREEKESISVWGSKCAQTRGKLAIFPHPWTPRRPHFGGSLDSKAHLALDDKKRKNKQNLPTSSSVQVWGYSVSG